MEAKTFTGYNRLKCIIKTVVPFWQFQLSIQNLCLTEKLELRSVASSTTTKAFILSKLQQVKHENKTRATRIKM
jgi:hypothetical protein